MTDAQTIQSAFNSAGAAFDWALDLAAIRLGHDARTLRYMLASDPRTDDALRLAQTDFRVAGDIYCRAMAAHRAAQRAA